MIIDANVLIYAVVEESPDHDAALTFLKSAFEGHRRVGLPWLSLVAFQRVTTHPRIYPEPLQPEEASAYIDLWLGQENSWVPTPTSRHAAILRELTTATNATGNLVTDAHLAALAVEHGTAICSFDHDFAKFDGVRWINPRDLYR